MTFSLKYQDYQRALRQRKLMRAEKMIDSGSYKYERDTSPRAYVSQDHTTDNGEKATKTKATINIAKDADKDSVIAAAKEALGSRLSGNIIKEIYVPGRIVNIVAK